jgi:hypothetical protein
MKRRYFLRLAGSVAAANAIHLGAQQPEPMRLIASLSYLAAGDPEAKLYTEAFLQGLRDGG